MRKSARTQIPPFFDNDPYRLVFPTTQPEIVKSRKLPDDCDGSFIFRPLIVTVGYFGSVRDHDAEEVSPIHHTIHAKHLRFNIQFTLLISLKQKIN